MKAFMGSNFSQADERYSVIHSGSYNEKGTHWKMTGVVVIDSGSPDLGEMLVKTISSKDFKVLCQGKSLNVVRAKTKSASDRDGASQGSGIVKEATRKEGCLHRMGWYLRQYGGKFLFVSLRCWQRRGPLRLQFRTFEVALEKRGSRSEWRSDCASRGSRPWRILL